MATYRILALDGGGIRGLFTTVVLQRLQRMLPGWLNHVDLIAGTSTGGIIALGLAAGKTPTQLRQLYYSDAHIVFQDSWLDNLRDLGKLLGADYSTQPLRLLLEAHLGADTCLGDLDKHVLIPTFNLDKRYQESGGQVRSWAPKFFHNFPIRAGASDSDDRMRKVVDVALYTSAAPTYFPIVDGYVDGGVCTNNPSMAAVAQCQDRRIMLEPRPYLDEIVVLSVGTGMVQKFVPVGEACDGESPCITDWGIVQWGTKLVDIVLDGINGVADYQCKQLLGEHYQRLNTTFAASDKIALDDTSQQTLDRLVELGMRIDLSATVAWLQKYWFTEQQSDFFVPSGNVGVLAV